uniref:Putative methyl-CpG-binding domain-containing protein 11-like n=1 Tax=Davidia involucrata TaxID=16924 RepID=A0A5B6YKY9_DAVIN
MENNESSGQEKGDDVVAIDLPAPEGWKKKFTPKKGGTPRRNEIVFISPTGEEIKNKRQLDQYLKSHLGGPSVSEFDWGTGDTPRRSARISEKSKAIETPEPEPPKKVQRKSSSKKGAKEEDDIDGEVETAKGKEAATEETKESAEVEMKDVETSEDKEAAVEETKGSADREADTEETKKSAEVEMKDEDDVENQNKGEVATEEAVAGKDTVKDSEQKTEIKIDETTMENLEASNEATSGAKEEDGGNKSLPMPGLEENDNEAEKEQAEPEAPSQVPVPNETANSEQEEKTVEVAVPEVAEAKVENESEVASVEGEIKPDSDSLKEDQEVGKAISVNCEEAPHESKASQVSY